jgi:hypothetical protein
MRVLLFFLMPACVLIGCRSRPQVSQSWPGNTAPQPPPQGENGRPQSVPRAETPPIMTPGGPLRGRVASVNPAGRFVVLRFPIGAMPPLQRTLSVYRDGLKVGELKVSGPQYDNNIVADIVAGECLMGDEARTD